MIAEVNKDIHGISLEPSGDRSYWGDPRAPSGIFLEPAKIYLTGSLYIKLYRGPPWDNFLRASQGKSLGVPK
jgi:hypothetical protein